MALALVGVNLSTNLLGEVLDDTFEGAIEAISDRLELLGLSVDE